MGIDVTRTISRSATGSTATITWKPKQDDPLGYLAHAIDTERLGEALTALGTPTVEDLPARQLPDIARSTAAIQRELERRTRAMVVQLKDRDNLSWSEIADILYGDPSKRSSARAAYEAGLRQTGHQPGGPTVIEAGTVHGPIVIDGGNVIIGGDTH
ncbi:hypothetical protein ACFVHW_07670 [Streptomyces sp. NPDC127110]|uniref:hypothetical protein n=1 Tax=Streptomyces sp. NPDC127110 TaxID=3345362 RepID=UPI00362E0291